MSQAATVLPAQNRCGSWLCFVHHLSFVDAAYNIIWKINQTGSCSVYSSILGSVWLGRVLQLCHARPETVYLLWKIQRLAIHVPVWSWHKLIFSYAWALTWAAALMYNYSNWNLSSFFQQMADWHGITQKLLYWFASTFSLIQESFRHTALNSLSEVLLK